jgi:hypothetical protein
MITRRLTMKKKLGFFYQESGYLFIQTGEFLIPFSEEIHFPLDREVLK